MKRGATWKFDAKVARVFDDILSRSIPQLKIMREAVFELGRRYVMAGTYVLDLGSSRGDAIAPFVDAFSPGTRFLGYEVSRPMRRAAEQRFKGDPAVSFSPDDLRIAALPMDEASVVLSVLTLQFIPINARQDVLRKAYLSLRPGGALIVVEKVLGYTYEIDRAMVSAYHALKERNGYTREAIERKALALEGVLVPLTAAWNEDMIHSAGFTRADVFWAWMNFRGWIAVK